MANSRLRYFAIRFAQMILVWWLIASAIFVFFRLIPGSYTGLMVFSGASEEAVRAFEMKWGLNQPIYIQYIKYFTNFLQGDFGTSLQAQRPVLEFVGRKILNTMILVAPAITVGYLIGMIIGALLGAKRGSRFEEYGLIPVIFTGSFPDFFLAIIMVIVFASWFGIFPTSTMYTYEEGLLTPWWNVYTTKTFAMHYILPFSTIVLRYLSSPTLVMRTSTVETMGQDFMFYHKVTGLPKVKRMSHLIKHSVLPLVTLYPISMTRAFSGLVLIEVVFSWPGIGKALVDAVFNQDYPVVQFIFFLVAAFIILANFVVDVVYSYIDPRISVDD